MYTIEMNNKKELILSMYEASKIKMDDMTGPESS